MWAVNTHLGNRDRLFSSMSRFPNRSAQREILASPHEFPRKIRDTLFRERSRGN